MSNILKVVEVLSESEQGWEDAAQKAVDRSTKTLEHVESVYIKEMSGAVKDGKISSFRVNAKITFRLEE